MKKIVLYLPFLIGFASIVQADQADPSMMGNIVHVTKELGKAGAIFYGANLLTRTMHEIGHYIPLKLYAYGTGQRLDAEFNIPLHTLGAQVIFKSTGMLPNEAPLCIQFLSAVSGPLLGAFTSYSIAKLISIVRTLS
ncbi:MAG TPA: hypothetical protein VGW78_00635 [Candidatus Babeliales bacterium]|jgi:hypothetical protein|nr:hypothetical protein [Candidatus Babeliales bacterium]